MADERTAGKQTRERVADAVDEARDDATDTAAEVKGRWQRVQDANPWLRHVLAAYQLLTRNHGNSYAGAITYFSFVALFPLLLLAVSVAGFVLDSHPALLSELLGKISDSVPGDFGKTLKDSIQAAIDARAGVGIVGLFGVLLTGLGWIGNLREAIDGVWGRPPAKKNFVMARVSNLVVLAGLGLGIAISLTLTTAGTSLTSQILSAVGLDAVPGFTLLLKVLGIAIAVGGDMIIFWWVLIRLPQAEVDKKVALRGAVLASVGFEILKIVGTYTVAHAAANTKTGGPFISIIAVLAWIYLVSRWMLFCCAWLATGNAAARAANTVPIVEPPAMTDEPPAGASAVTPAKVGVTLVGAGAVAGAVATWALRRPRDED